MHLPRLEDGKPQTSHSLTFRSSADAVWQSDQTRKLGHVGCWYLLHIFAILYDEDRSVVRHGIVPYSSIMHIKLGVGDINKADESILPFTIPYVPRCAGASQGPLARTAELQATITSGMETQYYVQYVPPWSCASMVLGVGYVW